MSIVKLSQIWNYLPLQGRFLTLVNELLPYFIFFRYLSYLISYGIVQMCAWKFVMRLVGTFLKSMSNRQKILQKPQIILPKSTGEFAWKKHTKIFSLVTIIIIMFFVLLNIWWLQNIVDESWIWIFKKNVEKLFDNINKILENSKSRFLL